MGKSEMAVQPLIKKGKVHGLKKLICETESSDEDEDLGSRDWIRDTNLLLIPGASHSGTGSHKFMQVLKSLVSIVIPEPNWPWILNIGNQLWMGEMMSTEFVDNFINNHLDAGNVITYKLLEHPVPTNLFNTLEACLVLEDWHQGRKIRKSGKIVAGKSVANVLSRIKRRISENENVQNAGHDLADVDNQPQDHGVKHDTVDNGLGGQQQASSGPSSDDARMNLGDVLHDSGSSPDGVQQISSLGTDQTVRQMVLNLPLGQTMALPTMIWVYLYHRLRLPHHLLLPPPHLAHLPSIPLTTTHVPQGDVVKEALRQLTEYLRHHSLEEYQATLRLYYPAEYAGVIKDYVHGMAHNNLTQEGSLH
ncbi:hypothetical protein DEU56DRAFT_752449 [Suillus clintonianus]|uniref:uncharacterized protein n=1 Tax=Suillus clintonianus TaxID=1904413 RepID=UPI001B86D8B6|nr:uncharacterized protein DEU56DRAFT_752449 [Suillus clintonianus]KAG2150775.1 hypothetical protein DEU56DRAFT_752449 [Suillus clintonianus]